MRKGVVLIVTLWLQGSSAELFAAEAGPTASRAPGAIGGRALVGLESSLLAAANDWSLTRGQEGDVTSDNHVLGLTLGVGFPSVVFGYGLTDDWLLSGDLLVQKEQRDTPIAQESTSVRATPAVTYLLGAGHLRPFAGVQGYFGRQTGYVDSNSLGGGIHGGFRFELGERISMEPLARVNYVWSHDEFDTAALFGDSESHHLQGQVAARLAGWF